MKKFEYRETTLVITWESHPTIPNTWKADGILETKLNLWGQDGWEVVYLKGSGMITSAKAFYHVVFKREIPQ